MTAALGLESAATALHAGDFDAALEILLTHWEASRAPELAQLIADASETVTKQLPALTAKTQRGGLTEWVELARQKRPSDVGRLIAAMAQATQELGAARLLVPRLDEIIQLRPDPRLAAAVLTLSEPRALTGGPTGKVYLRVAKALTQHADPQLTERLTAVASHPFYSGTAEAQRFGALIKAWRKRWPEPTLPPKGLDHVRAALAKAPPPAAPKPRADQDGAALLTAVYEAPDDDGRRLVYADWLSERGDARGELIVLQLDRHHGKHTPATEKRERALIKAHGTAWLGPLTQEIVVGETVWERGFPARTRTKLVKLYQAEASFIRPEWATFVQIRFDGASLLTDQMRGLHEASGVSETAIKRLTKVTRRLPVRVLDVVLETAARLRADEPTLAMLIAREKLPELRELTLRSPRRALDGTAPWTSAFCNALGALERLTIVDQGLCSGRLYAPIIDDNSGGQLRALSWGDGLVQVTARREPGQRWSHLDIAFLTEPPPLAADGWLEEPLASFSPGTFETASISGVGPKMPPAVMRAVEKVARRIV